MKEKISGLTSLLNESEASFIKFFYCSCHEIIFYYLLCIDRNSTLFCILLIPLNYSLYIAIKQGTKQRVQNLCKLYLFCFLFFFFMSVAFGHINAIILINAYLSASWVCKISQSFNLQALLRFFGTRCFIFCICCCSFCHIKQLYTYTKKYTTSTRLIFMYKKIPSRDDAARRSGGLI